MDLELVAVAVEQGLPVEPVRDDVTQGGVLALVGHLEEQQVGELLDVLDGRHAVVSQHVAEVPQLLDELVRAGQGDHETRSSTNTGRSSRSIRHGDA